MPRLGRVIASAAVSLALVTGSTAAVASTETAPPPAQDSWIALSMLTPSGTAFLGTAGTTAAAQPDTIPPPPPPGYGGGSGTPPIPVLVVWGLVLATIIYIALHNKHHHHVPNSPA